MIVDHQDPLADRGAVLQDVEDVEDMVAVDARHLADAVRQVADDRAEKQLVTDVLSEAPVRLELCFSKKLVGGGVMRKRRLV